MVVGEVEKIHITDVDCFCMGIKCNVFQTLQLILSNAKLLKLFSFPTEEEQKVTSFSLLNLKELLNCPYGQFITTLWRGSESREMIYQHLSSFFDEIIKLVKNGVTLSINDNMEMFNVICFFVADLCFVKDVIGQCSCTSLYGCYHCSLKSNEWNSPVKKIGKPKTIVVTKTRNKPEQPRNKRNNPGTSGTTQEQARNGFG